MGGLNLNGGGPGGEARASYIPPHMRGKVGGPAPGGPGPAPVNGGPPMNGGINGSAWGPAA